MNDQRRLGRRLTASYALIQSIVNMGYCCVMSFAAVFLLSRGFTDYEIGITLTVATALAILCQPLVAAFADRTEKIALKGIVAAMLAASALLSLLLLVTPSLVLPTAIIYVLLACIQGIESPLVTSLSMEHINSGVPLNFSLARGIGSFAFASLSLLLGFLVRDLGGWIVMAASSAIAVGGVVLVSTFRRPANEEARFAANGGGQALGSLEFARRNPRFMGIVVSVALLFFSHVIINTYTIQIVRHVGGNSSDMGIATAIAGFLELPAMALFPLALRMIRSPAAIMKLSGLFFVLKTLVTLLAPSVAWIYAAQCFQFFAYAMFIPASVYYVNEKITGLDKVKGQAFMGVALGIAGMTGDFFGGLMLGTSGGVPFALAVGLVVSLAGLILLVVIDGFRPRRSRPSVI